MKSESVLHLDIVTGLLGSGRAALAKALQKQQSNTVVVAQGASPDCPIPYYAQQHALSVFAQDVLPSLNDGQNTVFVTNLCDDLAPAEALIKRLRRLLQTKCSLPIRMNVVHLQPTEPSACVEELLRRQSPITDHIVRTIQAGFRFYRSHGPCYPAFETVVLPPLCQGKRAAQNASSLLLQAKGERKELTINDYNMHELTTTQARSGFVIRPKTAQGRTNRASAPANTRNWISAHP